MTDMTLVIGNKNYSSWSLRAWLMLKQTDVPFDEILIPLDRPGFKDEILAHSAAGCVPVLKTGVRAVWDSLAIGEFLAEIFPQAGLWPVDAMVRAEARAVACEMHSGFDALRRHMPMDLRARLPGRGQGPGVAMDIERITAIWRTCRAEHAGDGAFLFGGFSIADAMFAPVVGRLHTYGVPLDDICQAYADAVRVQPAMRAWADAAASETWVIEHAVL